jgi:23S rRNA (pseudouridine1915-N3)-methyltransferase
MPAWINTGFKEFNKRLPKEFLLNLVEVQPVTRGKSSSAEKIMMEESKRIRANIPEGCLIVALDEHGKQLDSVSLSKNLKHG